MADEIPGVGETAVHTYERYGEYTVTVVDTVTNLATEKTITIAPFGAAPNFRVERAQPTDYAKATLTPVSADHDYVIDWGDNSSTVTIPRNSTTPVTHQYPPGVNTYEVVGSDEINGKSKTVEFTTQAVPNAPEFSMTQDTVDKLKWTLELTKADNPCTIDWGDGDGQRRAYSPPPTPPGSA